MEKIKTLFRTTITSRITTDQKQKIERLARQSKTTKSEYVRSLLINTIIPDSNL